MPAHTKPLTMNCRWLKMYSAIFTNHPALTFFRTDKMMSMGFQTTSCSGT